MAIISDKKFNLFVIQVRDQHYDLVVNRVEDVCLTIILKVTIIIMYSIINNFILGFHGIL